MLIPECPISACMVYGRHTCTHARPPSCLLTRMHACRDACTHVRTDACTHACRCMHAHTQVRRHAHRHAGTHASLLDAAFKKISSGTCVESGAAPIHTMSLCEKAAAALGLPDTSVSTTASIPRPEGCYWFKGTQLWISENRSSSGNGYTAAGNATREPICATRGASSDRINP